MNFPFPFMPPMMPFGMPPPYNGEVEKLKKELEYQKELNERREREMRREREDLLERERQRQRDLDLDRERRLKDMEMMYKNNQNEKNGGRRGGGDDSYLIERERDKFDRMKEKLEEQIDKKKEEIESIKRDLNLTKDQLKIKEEELFKTNQELKEKKEIIETKDKEIQLLKENRDKDLQKLKDDNERELNIFKKDMKNKIKKKDEKIKKKEKLIEQQKKEKNELKKDLTTNNTFYSNNMMNGSTFRQNFNLDFNPMKKEQEKIDSPQVVVSINSIFTDEELNAMDYEQSIQFDRRTLCQVYISYINRKQPLFFFFNYNSSSTGISIFQINYQSIRFIFVCIDLMLYLFIYCTFFGSKSVSLIFEKKYTFRKMCILGIIISPFCLIIRSIIHHFVYDPMNKKIAEIKIRCYTNFNVGKKKEEMKVNEFRDFWESDGGQQQKNNNNKEEIEKKEEIDEIQDIENDENLCEEEKIRRKDKYEKRRLKQLIKEIIALFEKKIKISFCVLAGVMVFEWVYVSCFCAVYKNSQLKFFVSILICYAFSNLIPFFYCLIPTVLKQDAVRDESRFLHFMAFIFQLI